MLDFSPPIHEIMEINSHIDIDESLYSLDASNKRYLYDRRPQIKHHNTYTDKLNIQKKKKGYDCHEYVCIILRI